MAPSRPKILFLAHRVPYPPNRGDRIRSFHLLRFLAPTGGRLAGLSRGRTALAGNAAGPRTPVQRRGRLAAGTLPALDQRRLLLGIWPDRHRRSVPMQPTPASAGPLVQDDPFRRRRGLLLEHGSILGRSGAGRRSGACGPRRRGQPEVAPLRRGGVGRATLALPDRRQAIAPPGAVAAAEGEGHHVGQPLRGGVVQVVLPGRLGPCDSQRRRSRLFPSPSRS